MKKVIVNLILSSVLIFQYFSSALRTAPLRVPQPKPDCKNRHEAANALNCKPPNLNEQFIKNKEASHEREKIPSQSS